MTDLQQVVTQLARIADALERIAPLLNRTVEASLLTIDEASAHLEVPKDQLAEWIEEHGLTVRFAAGTKRYIKDELDELLDHMIDEFRRNDWADWMAVPKIARRLQPSTRASDRYQKEWLKIFMLSPPKFSAQELRWIEEHKRLLRSKR